MATNDAASAADLAGRWNGNSPRLRLVQNWDIVVHYCRRWHGLYDCRVQELMRHVVMILDYDTVGKHVLLGHCGTNTIEQDDGACGGCHNAKDEEERDTKDDDIANTADSGSHDDIVVEVDENENGRKEHVLRQHLLLLLLTQQ